MIRRAVLVGTFAFGVAAFASPALSQPVPFSWTGAYIGGNAGASFHPSAPAFSGGGQIGYSYQVNPNWVLGVEADLQTANIRRQTSSGQAFPTSVPGAPFVCQLGNPARETLPARSFDLTDPTNLFAGLVQTVTGARTVSTPEQCAALFSNPTFRATVTGAFGAIAPLVTLTNSPTAVLYGLSGALDWFGTLRARLGFEVTNGLLLYVTGGLAYGEGRLAYTTTTSTTVTALNPFLTPTQTTFSSFVTTQDRILLGYAIGGGAEYAFHRNWSVKGEYLYVDLGDAGMGTQSVNFKTSVVRFGVNYRFAAAQ